MKELKQGATIREQAKWWAAQRGGEVVSTASHRQEGRLRKEFRKLEFYGPARLGSKTRIFIGYR
jgi:hypothetical protein